MPPLRVTVTVKARGTSAIVELPLDAKEVFGRVPVPVRVTVNGYTFRTTTMRYGGVDLIGLNRDVRDGAAIAPGDVVTLAIELNTDERTVAVPEDLAAALAADPQAAEAFGRLSYTHRKEYTRWIGQAKRAETRRTRLDKTITMLRSGVRHP